MSGKEGKITCKFNNCGWCKRKNCFWCGKFVGKNGDTHHPHRPVCKKCLDANKGYWTNTRKDLLAILVNDVGEEISDEDLYDFGVGCIHG